MRFAASVFLHRLCLILFDAVFELLTWIFLIQLSLWVGIKHNTLTGNSCKFLSKDYMQQEIYLFISTNITPQKRKLEKQCFEVFSQGLEEMHKEISKDGE